MWVWLAMDRRTRPIIAFHVGDRSREIAKQLWANLPEVYCRQARCYNTLRQRVSRLVRATLAFSKKVENHIGAIRYFICYDNLARATALPV
jgi:insertion element IS1 protein InsB